MIYVFDTNVFIVLAHFYPSAFPSLWDRIDGLVAAGVIVSVSEVLNELERTSDSGFLQAWIKKNKRLFAKPSNEELLAVQEILAVPHFQAIIGTKALLRGLPVADPFVVAAARVKGGAVVTQERHKPNAAKIPNVCQHFQIPCMDLQTFMKQQDWSF